MAIAVTVPEELEVLAEKIGDFVAYWGFKKIHGKIWAHIFTAKDPLDAADLIRRLKISKALVSLTLKDLLHYRVVLEVGRSDRGTILYRANQKVVEVIVNVLRQREKLLLKQIHFSHEKVLNLPQDGSLGVSICHTQVKTLGNLISEAEACLDHVIALHDLSLEPWRTFATNAGAMTSEHA